MAKATASKKITLESVRDLIMKTADDKKAENMVAYDVRELTPVTDLVVIVSATNYVHCHAVVEAIAQEVQRMLRREDKGEFFYPPKLSGDAESGWVVVDLNVVLVHVMVADIREYYGLDALYQDRAVVYHY